MVCVLPNSLHCNAAISLSYYNFCLFILGFANEIYVRILFHLDIVYIPQMNTEQFIVPLFQQVQTGFKVGPGLPGRRPGTL